MTEVEIVRAPARHALDELEERMAGPLRAAGAERAIVFGSYARGTADGFSDLDLAVVLETDLPFLDRGGLLRALLAALPKGLGVDILVFTPEEYRRGTERDRGVFHEMRSHGVTVYERA